jgi:hypothetical protein
MLLKNVLMQSLETKLANIRSRMMIQSPKQAGVYDGIYVCCIEGICGNVLKRIKGGLVALEGNWQIFENGHASCHDKLSCLENSSASEYTCSD